MKCPADLHVNGSRTRPWLLDPWQGEGTKADKGTRSGSCTRDRDYHLGSSDSGATYDFRSDGFDSTYAPFFRF